ncbi:serine incorporator/TMS membrane protein [Tribonema minus]|uniref:Serine incorporator/TMS membrane protein n=1 Tax=Tribonema minus TaxID=303371 RepID=A0A836CG76_9STRA|nr:serine incorporator/TMS membrane protein [Tribonema minus]
MALALGCFACTACSAVCTTVSTVCSCAGCLCGSAFGSSTPRDLMVGKLRSMGLVMVSIVLGLLTQYMWADKLADKLDQWNYGCDGNQACQGNAAILRVSMVDSIFFFVMMVGSFTGSLFNNRCWALKLTFWSVMIIASVFISNAVFDDHGYVWAARFGAFLFIILQQIVLIDIAYQWNDACVKKAQDLGEDGEGRKVLVALVCTSLLLFAVAISGVGVLFGYFKGCQSNDIILSLTLIMIVAMTVLQLSGPEGNLLTSALVSVYMTFLGFSAVSKNPDASCNPFIGSSQNLTSIIVGLVLTFLSLLWICASSGTSITKLLGGEAPPTTASLQLQVESVRNAEAAKASGSPSTGMPFIAQSAPAPPEEPEPDDHGDGWKFNIVMILLSMFFGMMLTNWGVVQSDSSSIENPATYSDPKNGEAAMWLTAAGQWACMLLYTWTLVAPKLFPDRDFS